MQSDPNRPQGDNVKQPNKAKEELHVDSAFVAYADLEQDEVDRVEEGAEEGEEVAGEAVGVGDVDVEGGRECRRGREGVGGGDQEDTEEPIRAPKSTRTDVQSAKDAALGG